jgi:hypothetical protein
LIETVPLASVMPRDRSGESRIQNQSWSLHLRCAGSWPQVLFRQLGRGFYRIENGSAAGTRLAPSPSKAWSTVLRVETVDAVKADKGHHYRNLYPAFTESKEASTS